MTSHELRHDLSPEQVRRPYVEALQRHAEAAPLHVTIPGHGRSESVGGQALSKIFGEQVVDLDLPIMLPGIDLGGTNPLRMAANLAAEAWGARRAWFLTNGASQGNRTSALAVRGLGERVLVQRNTHSSFIDGVLLAGLEPAFVTPAVDEQFGIAHGITPSELASQLRAAQLAGRPFSSVFVISPNYFGSVSDIAELARVAHRYDAALIVDGAWGAHFGFHPDLPESPSRLGADLVVSSTHKLAGSLTQSAMLLLGEGPFADRLEPLVLRAYRMTASTSPSTLLMASLDAARHGLVQGHATIGRSIRLSQEFRERLRADGRYGVVGDTFAAFDDVVATDPLRIPVDTSALGQSGHWVRDRLISDHGVYFEMATAGTIVAVFGALASPDLDRVMAALSAVADDAEALRAAGGAQAPTAFPPLPPAGPLRMLPREAYLAASELVPAAEAIGRISADTLSAYPPGIPNIMPGEEVTAENVAFVQAVAASPTGVVRGANDAQVAMLRVTAQHE